MKTAEEILNAAVEAYNSQVSDISKFKLNTKEIAMFTGCMKAFASQAIDEAAKEASVHHEGGGIWSVDRASILKVKELLK